MIFDQPSQKVSESQQEEELSEEFISKAGHFYLEWLHQAQTAKGSHEIMAQGSVAVRDLDFIEEIPKWRSQVDPVGYDLWKQDFQKLFKQDQNSAIQVFGLSQSKSTIWNWVTYQFAHSGSPHLITNLLFLLFFGAVVEEMVGGLLLGALYLIGGVIGGLFFLLMDSSGLIPLVGASASVTALIAFVATGSLKKNIQYFFLPAIMIPDFDGRFYMSPLWIIPLALLGDISAVLANPPGYSDGVSYSAHLGGAFAGLILGWSYKFGIRRATTKASMNP